MSALIRKRWLRRPWSAGSRGFTLVELLVALTLLGLISVVLLGGLRFGTRAWEAGDARADALGEIDAVQSMLRRQIVQAIVPRLVAPDLERDPMFVGEEGRLRLVTAVPAHLGVGGLYHVEIKFVEDIGKGRLELAWHLFRPDQPGALDDAVGDQDTLVAGRRVLLEDVDAVVFAYYDSGGPQGQGEWADTWDDADGLPDLISLKVRFADESGRLWPELVVRPRLAGDELRG